MGHIPAVEAIREMSDRSELETLQEQLVAEVRPRAEEIEEKQRELRPLQDQLYTVNTRLSELGR